MLFVKQRLHILNDYLFHNYHQKVDLCILFLITNDFLEKYSCPEIFTDEPTEEDCASIFQAHCARIEHECQV